MAVWVSAARHNNAMQPTAHSVAFMRETPFYRRPFAAADGGRSAAHVVFEA